MGLRRPEKMDATAGGERSVLCERLGEGANSSFTFLGTFSDSYPPLALPQIFSLCSGGWICGFGSQGEGKPNFFIRSHGLPACAGVFPCLQHTSYCHIQGRCLRSDVQEQMTSGDKVAEVLRAQASGLLVRMPVKMPISMGLV